MKAIDFLFMNIKLTNLLRMLFKEFLCVFILLVKDVSGSTEYQNHLN